MHGAGGVKQMSRKKPTSIVIPQHGPMITDLFSSKTVARRAKNITPNAEQKRHAEVWLGMLERGELKKEMPSYFTFTDTILIGILGYTKERLKMNEDDMEFQATNKNGTKVLCIEAKGSETDLYKYQSRGKADKKKPIYQTWMYVGMGDRKYGICTNYNKFILITRAGGSDMQFVFDFDSIRTDPEQLKTFIAVFSMDSLIDSGASEELRKESEKEQRDFTEKFYNLFHQTRMMLIDNFRQNGLSREKSIYFSQIMLNRLMFIFFVSDRGILSNSRMFTDELNKQIQAGGFSENSQKIYSEMSEIFGMFDKGSRIFGVNEFNGSLFSGKFPRDVFFLDLDPHQQARTNKNLPALTKGIKTMQKAEPNLNPIITNILMMDQYDFNTEVDVSILGHIFEQSLSDIELLKKQDAEQKGEDKKKDPKIDGRRKKEGVYYTPKYITEYICKNTIVSYLSKSGTSSIQTLLSEYEDEYDALEVKIKNLRILDPACGSGAFLIQAVDTLLAIRQEIHDRKFEDSTQYTLDETWEDVTTREIITENIYGVDLNKESVEITKLSLFLKMVTNNNPLIDLQKNIKVGNSVISDTSKPGAFDWKANFPDIMSDEGGGFDVIIGNPPYVRQEELDYKDSTQLPSANTLKGNPQMDKKMDLSGYFYYHSLNILKDEGMLGFISSDSWLHMGYGVGMRELFLSNCNILRIIKYEFNVFEDADIVTATTILKKTTGSVAYTMLCRATSEEATHEGNFICKIMPQTSLDMDKNWNVYFPQMHFEPSIEMIKMKNAGKVKFGKKTGCNDFFLLTQEIIAKYNIVWKYRVPAISKNMRGGYLKGKQITEYLLNVNVSKGDLAKNEGGRDVLKYIEAGERMNNWKGFDDDKDKIVVSTISSVASRNPWYSLNLNTSTPIFLAQFANKQMKIYENDGSFYARNNFDCFTPDNDEHKHAFLAYFVSSWFSLYMEKNGHVLGGGAMRMLTNDYKKALVPDFTKIPQETIDELKKAWLKYREDFERDELDEVVFSALGFSPEQGEEIKAELERHIDKRTSR